MDEDNHKRHEVADETRQCESHYFSFSASTLDHNWALQEVGKQERSVKCTKSDSSGGSNTECLRLFDKHFSP